MYISVVHLNLNPNTQAQLIVKIFDRYSRWKVSVLHKLLICGQCLFVDMREKLKRRLASYLPLGKPNIACIQRTLYNRRTKIPSFISHIVMVISK